MIIFPCVEIEKGHIDFLFYDKCIHCGPYVHFENTSCTHILGYYGLLKGCVYVLVVLHTNSPFSFSTNLFFLFHQQNIQDIFSDLE